MSSRSPDYEARLSTLKALLAGRFEEVARELAIDVRWDGVAWRGPCPVHGGDNPGGLLLYTGGHSAPGFWRCHTRRCQEQFPANLAGFVQGVLSAQKRWKGPGDRKVPFREAVEWACKALKVRFWDLEAEPAELERARFSAVLGTLGKRPAGLPATPRSAFAPRLNCPSPYFLGRGFRPETLEHFGVGDASAGPGLLSGRAVAPVLDENGDALGFAGRSVHQKCNGCGLFHPTGPCPPPDGGQKWSKWVNSHFASAGILYNWPPLRAERRPRVVVLCEGPGEVWRLWEAGIRCGVARFGVDLSDAQQVVLETGGVLGVIVAANNDSAGISGARKVLEKLGRGFYVSLWRPAGEDVGDTPAELVARTLTPLITRMESQL
jgi:hypothetical protein